MNIGYFIDLLIEIGNSYSQAGFELLIFLLPLPKEYWFILFKNYSLAIAYMRILTIQHFIAHSLFHPTSLPLKLFFPSSPFLLSCFLFSSYESLSLFRIA